MPSSFSSTGRSWWACCTLAATITAVPSPSDDVVPLAGSISSPNDQIRDLLAHKLRAADFDADGRVEVVVPREGGGSSSVVVPTPTTVAGVTLTAGGDVGDEQETSTRAGGDVLGEQDTSTSAGSSYSGGMGGPAAGGDNVDPTGAGANDHVWDRTKHCAGTTTWGLCGTRRGQDSSRGGSCGKTESGEGRGQD